jgi:hypothetical protein
MPEYNIALERKPNPIDPTLPESVHVCGTVYWAAGAISRSGYISANRARRDASMAFAKYWLEAADRFQEAFEKDAEGDNMPEHHGRNYLHPEEWK